ncbi:NAD(P)/FAD-dependent oxidoreductase [Sphingomicrobium marinum]|uniref:NAD(P)/FAD-dependent oxidoreductase n=1 Tax=Sphingomicrobium marinum TaxID=1227950 RepID=UPI00223F302D|nr:FAD-dependent oxidoreductase [Sphingomicrobium marinum]
MGTKIDILIVGGGIAGASLGARLAGAGKRVILLETEAQCGMHATGRSAAFWQASLGGDSPERALSLASKPMFDARWPGADVPLLRERGAFHLTGPCGEDFPNLGSLEGEHRPVKLDREEVLEQLPGLGEHYTGGWWEESCADIDVAAFHQACLAAFRRAGGEVVAGQELQSARFEKGVWHAQTAMFAIDADIIVNAAGAWGDVVAERCGVTGLGLQARRRTVVQLEIDRTGLRDTPFVTDLHASFYFKGEGDSSVWVCPLDVTPSPPCDSAPEEIDVATAIDRFQQAINWPVVRVEHKWSGLRTFAPDEHMKFGFDKDAAGFFWCVGQGGMGIQAAPAYSLLCAHLILGDDHPEELEGIDPAAFQP